MSIVMPYVAISNNGKVRPVGFHECVLCMLNGQGTKDEDLHVSFGYDQESGALILEKCLHGCKLIHPRHCPFVHLSDAEIDLIPSGTRGKGVHVGVSVLLLSQDLCVLLTRRAAHMRTFPCVWVPPGGHLEVGESLDTAALRELQEETGISLKSNEFTMNVLGFFESGFPAFKEWGTPTHHHIVVYFVVKCSVPRLDLHDRIILQENEVDSCCWLGLDDVKFILQLDTFALERSIAKYVCNNGCLTTTALDLSILSNAVHPGMAEMERISTGSQFALQLLYSNFSTLHSTLQ